MGVGRYLVFHPFQAQYVGVLGVCRALHEYACMEAAVQLVHQFGHTDGQSC